MIESTKIQAAIELLADTCMAASGDMHVAHLNYRGIEFDTMHKKVLKKYYEQLAEDYDSLAEFAGCYGAVLKNPNESAKRAEWQSFEGECNRDSAIKLVDEVLEAITKLMVDTYKALNKIDTCPIAVGIANWLQTRLEYWMKEQHYFNARRA